MKLRLVMLLALAAGLLAGPARPAQGAEERVCVPGQTTPWWVWPRPLPGCWCALGTGSSRGPG